MLPALPARLPNLFDRQRHVDKNLIEKACQLCSETVVLSKEQSNRVLNQAIQAGERLRHHITQQPWKETLIPLLNSSGTYYGLPHSTIYSLTTARPHPKNIRDTMAETLDEVRSMRLEMEALRRELQEMRQQVLGFETDQGETEEQRIARNVKVRKRQHRFEQLAKEIEAWARQILFETSTSDESWTRIECHKTYKTQGERTQAFLKWMKDSRGKLANPNSDFEYPCLRMYSTIDAPFDLVCGYLAQPERMTEYNHLLEESQDLEEISSSSKICLGETPQILFVKPREFVTFCSHRWLPDGSLLIVNQAVDDDEFDTKTKQRPRAYAFRGANYISKHPDDPDNKTRICMLAHGSPGDDVPVWAMKTAVRTLAPIEPFKLFHKINEGVRQAQPMLEERLKVTDSLVCEGRVNDDNKVSSRPAGISQLGYACFWPNGGGVQELSEPSTSALTAADSPEESPTTGTTSPSEPKKISADTPSSPKEAQSNELID